MLVLPSHDISMTQHQFSERERDRERGKEKSSLNTTKPAVLSAGIVALL